MKANKISQLETLLVRKFSEEEIAWLCRIKDVLEISDDDALWDILAAMEYQRAYYEEKPLRKSCKKFPYPQRKKSPLPKEALPTAWRNRRKSSLKNSI